MSDTEWESGEEEIDESGRNPTQRQIDEEQSENEPTHTKEKRAKASSEARSEQPAAVLLHNFSVAQELSAGA